MQSCQLSYSNNIRYRTLEILAGGGSALVEWRLETGRTHQVPYFLLQGRLHCDA